MRSRGEFQVLCHGVRQSSMSGSSVGPAGGTDGGPQDSWGTERTWGREKACLNEFDAFAELHVFGELPFLTVRDPCRKRGAGGQIVDLRQRSSEVVVRRFSACLVSDDCGVRTASRQKKKSKRARGLEGVRASDLGPMDVGHALRHVFLADTISEGRRRCSSWRRRGRFAHET